MTTSIDYTVDQTDYSVSKSVYRTTLSPTSANTLLAVDVIEMLDEEMRASVVPLILAAQEEYYVQNYDQTLVAGTYNYTINPRAAFATWRDIVLVDSLGNEINMTELPPEYVKISFPLGNMPPIYANGFVLQNDHITLWPPNITVPTQYTLRMKIKRRPNHLTSVDNCGQITDITTNIVIPSFGIGTLVTLANVPTDWTASTTFDIIPNSPQFTSRGDDTAIWAVSSSASTVSISALPTGTVVGDWFCPATMSCIPQIPYDLFPLLAQRGVIRFMEAIGDMQSLQVAERKYQDMAADFARTVSPRVQGSPKKLVNRTANFGYGINRAISR